jgi:copper homeostasis protein
MTVNPYILEICCFNLQSCIVAAAAGADRIELCMDPGDGGVTPSYGLIRSARDKCAIRLYPIIRPRGGDFFYDDDDYAQMLLDIRLCKDLGCDGVVIGGLSPDGNIDKARCARLVEAAGSMGVTFHRAFDRVSDPLRALEDIIETGCERILTSGRRPTAKEGVPLIRELAGMAGNRIVIMPGGDVRAEGIVDLAAETGAREFHTAARVTIPSMMQFINPSMREQLTSVAVHSDEIRQMRTLLDSLNGGELNGGDPS